MEWSDDDFLDFMIDWMEDMQGTKVPKFSCDDWYLPTEMWVEILRHLTAKELLPIRLVCRRFRDIVDEWSLLSKKASVTFPKGIEMDGDYEPMFLLPSREAQLNNAKLFALGEWWSPFAVRLVELRLCWCRVLFPTFLEALRQASNLRRLELDKVDFIGVNNSTRDVKCDQMERLSIKNIDFALYDAFAQIFPRLKILNLQPKWNNPQKIINFVAAIQDTLEQYGPFNQVDLLTEIARLPRLKLKRVSCNFFYPASPTQLISISQLQPCIEHLDLANNIVSSKTLCKISTILRNLKQICFKLDRRKTPINVSFLNAMPGLECLSIRACNHQSMNLSKCCSPNLKQLSLTNVYLSHASWNFLEHSPNTREIALKNCLLENWRELFDPINRLTRLHSLTLHKVQVQAHLDHYFLHPRNNLKSLKMSNCHFNKSTLVKLLTHCRQLRDLHLCEIESLDDATVLMVCQELTYLKTLTIERCTMTTNAAVMHVMYHCPQLEKAEIGGVTLR